MDQQDSSRGSPPGPNYLRCRGAKTKGQKSGSDSNNLYQIVSNPAGRYPSPEIVSPSFSNSDSFETRDQHAYSPAQSWSSQQIPQNQRIQKISGGDSCADVPGDSLCPTRQRQQDHQSPWHQSNFPQQPGISTPCPSVETRESCEKLGNRRVPKYLQVPPKLFPAPIPDDIKRLELQEQYLQQLQKPNSAQQFSSNSGQGGTPLPLTIGQRYIDAFVPTPQAIAERYKSSFIDIEPRKEEKKPPLQKLREVKTKFKGALKGKKDKKIKTYPTLITDKDHLEQVFGGRGGFAVFHPDEILLSLQKIGPNKQPAVLNNSESVVEEEENPRAGGFINTAWLHSKLREENLLREPEPVEYQKDAISNSYKLLTGESPSRSVASLLEPYRDFIPDSVSPAIFAEAGSNLEVDDHFQDRLGTRVDTAADESTAAEHQLRRKQRKEQQIQLQSRAILGYKTRSPRIRNHPKLSSPSSPVTLRPATIKSSRQETLTTETQSDLVPFPEIGRAEAARNACGEFRRQNRFQLWDYQRQIRHKEFERQRKLSSPTSTASKFHNSASPDQHYEVSSETANQVLDQKPQKRREAEDWALQQAKFYNSFKVFEQADTETSPNIIRSDRPTSDPFIGRANTTGPSEVVHETAFARRLKNQRKIEVQAEDTSKPKKLLQRVATKEGRKVSDFVAKFERCQAVNPKITVDAFQSTPPQHTEDTIYPGEEYVDYGPPPPIPRKSSRRTPPFSGYGQDFGGACEDYPNQYSSIPQAHPDYPGVLHSTSSHSLADLDLQQRSSVLQRSPTSNFQQRGLPQSPRTSHCSPAGIPADLQIFRSQDLPHTPKRFSSARYGPREYSPSVYSDLSGPTPPSTFPNLLPKPLSVVKTAPKSPTHHHPSPSQDKGKSRSVDSPTRQQESGLASADVENIDAFFGAYQSVDPNQLEEFINSFVSVQPANTEDLRSFLGACQTVEGPVKERLLLTYLNRVYIPKAISSKMDLLQVRPMDRDRQSTKMRAIEDARKMQATVIETSKKAGNPPPKYVLMELIGKGSFGRVYKGKDMISAEIVAVKIIDIDESDTLNPRLADTYSEFMKEVQALTLLSDVKARNINHVIEALPVGKAMWMVTEYCGGGSIATLASSPVLKPTPSGLKERFIIPILREVAEAVKWVHGANIIHRDLKCANVLITEQGGVQLCDFGVAGLAMDPRNRKNQRNTFIGTPHWMAPEIFEGATYDKEVDIWSFGSMAFEMATGLPPNARKGFGNLDPSQNPKEIANLLELNQPRLDTSGRYSEGLRDIVRVCMQYKPANRPTIEELQGHPYIFKTDVAYPSSTLSDLVLAFKFWENAGGDRVSLFMGGGAQGPSELTESEAMSDDWIFTTTPKFDEEFEKTKQTDTRVDLFQDVYGKGEDTSRPTPRPTRRRPPPEALAPMKQPLEKLFDPNTITGYDENSRSHYGGNVKPASDLPLRDDTTQTSIRDTMIDLGGHDVTTGLSSFADIDTLKPYRTRDNGREEDEMTSERDFSRPALSDPVDNPNRRTQDWTFPSMIDPPATANPELNRFPYGLQRPTVTPGSGTRPALVHHATEPVGVPPVPNQFLMTAPASPSRSSMIDLDEAWLPEPSRPSTADSATSQEVTSANPFHLENHASMYQSAPVSNPPREPSLYWSSDRGSVVVPLNDLSDFSDAEVPFATNGNGSRFGEQTFDDSDYRDSAYSQASAKPLSLNAGLGSRQRQPRAYTAEHIPRLPLPPSARALSGIADHDEMRSEVTRGLTDLVEHLECFRDLYEPLLGGERRDREREGRERLGGTDGELED